MEKAFCFCDGVMILSPNVALSICVHLPGVRALWVKTDFDALGSEVFGAWDLAESQKTHFMLPEFDQITRKNHVSRSRKAFLESG